MSKSMYCRSCKRQVVAVLEDGETSAPYEEHAEGCEAVMTKVITLLDAVPA